MWTKKEAKILCFQALADEKILIWYSGKEGREGVSVIFTCLCKGKRSLALICKDKVQSDYWILGLRAVISRCHSPLDCLRSCRRVQSCVNSPAGVFRKKQTLGLLDEATEYSQIGSLCGSPTLSETRFTDGLSHCFNRFCPLESVLSNMQNVMDMSVPNSPYFEPDHLKKRGMCWGADYEDNVSNRFVSYAFGTSRIEKDNLWKDVMIWGENIGGNVEGVVNRFAAIIKINADRPRFNAIGGNLYTWRDGANGMLGLADHERKLVPTCVAHLVDNNFVQVYSSRMMTVALANQSKVYTIGSGEHGQLGIPEAKDKSITLVQGKLKEFIKEIAAVPDGMLRPEVRLLRAEAISCEQKCGIGNQKIQDCQHKIEETWFVAREEAGRYKAAKQLDTMQEKVSDGRKEMNGVKLIPQLFPLYTNSSNFEGLQCAFVTLRLLPEVDNVSISPILFYDTP
ncbi:hypothetical protein M0R45_006200 [Rubus argutus]|uniref:PH domain-containing protein n=1 Tax=Rubus argutus TaxID=59490 RepID=A0AAW1YQ98_RUBAR